MIFSEREIQKVEKQIEIEPKTRAFMYRLYNGTLIKGASKIKANGEVWEAKIFMGQDLIDAMEDGWQDDVFVAPKPEKPPPIIKAKTKLKKITFEPQEESKKES